MEFTNSCYQFQSVARIAAVAVVLMQCKTSNSNSSVKILNGQQISETEMPSAVMLSYSSGKAACSGTFIGPNVILTAAHCHSFRLNYKGKYPVKIVEYWNRFSRVNHKDLSLMIFDQPLAPAVSALATQTPKIGSAFSLAGYGCDNQGVSGTKRSGKTALLEFSPASVSSEKVDDDRNRARMLVTGSSTMSSNAEDTNAVACPGDSGSAAFYKDEVVGVTSGSGLYVDVTAKENQDLLQFAVFKGAMIPGVSAAKTDLTTASLHDTKTWAVQSKLIQAAVEGLLTQVSNLKSTRSADLNDEPMYLNTLPIANRGPHANFSDRKNHLLISTEISKQMATQLAKLNVNIDATGDDGLKDYLAAKGLAKEILDGNNSSHVEAIQNFVTRTTEGYIVPTIVGPDAQEVYEFKIIKTNFKSKNKQLDHKPQNTPY